MYEELIKRLRNCAEVNSLSLYKRGLMKQAADAIEDLQKQLQKSEEDNINLTGWLAEEHARHLWIPVTERLPKADEEVLVYLWDNQGAYIAWVDQEGQWETNDFYVDKDYLPKAWLPLPKPYEPPKEESNGV